VNALLAGASGLVGREIARAWPGPGELRLLVRRPLPAPGPRCAVQVVDFAALPALAPAEMAFCALGTTIAQAGSQAAFRAVDFDAVLAFAQAARRVGVRRFAAVSALGASAGAATFYNRVKGEAEDALAQIGFEQLVLARPSLLLGDRQALAQPPRRGEWLATKLATPLAPLIPAAWRPIAAATVARALLRLLLADLPMPQGVAATRPPALRVVESAELQHLATG
jgi:uncharacterized protein YbjT (DUF2867 family)